MAEAFESLMRLPPNENRFGEGGLRLKGITKEKKSDFPLITIIIALFNGKEFLEETIKSILNQDYRHIELIVIDGGSNDGSVDILKKYDDQIDYWVSEKDKGISDAFNKGIICSNGNFINFQGDGDGLIGKNAISRLFNEITEQDMLVCGRIERIDIHGNHLYFSKFYPVFKKQSLLFKMSLPHQAIFMNQRMFKEFGLFDKANKYAMDYEHLLRAYHKFPEVITRDIVVSRWRADGIGEGRTPDILREYDVIKRKNKVASPAVLTMINHWSRLKHQIKKAIGKTT